MSWTEEDLKRIRENCPEWKEIGCSGERRNPKEIPIAVECPDNETCPASTK